MAKRKLSNGPIPTYGPEGVKYHIKEVHARMEEICDLIDRLNIESENFAQYPTPTMSHVKSELVNTARRSVVSLAHFIVEHAREIPLPDLDACDEDDPEQIPLF